ncbi:MAG: DUF4864 domain-containing protein [SAR324 cluster bacterium]|nr:DUF4864 domain-containing protein [SAR324 cluster bacterium]
MPAYTRRCRRGLCTALLLMLFLPALTLGQLQPSSEDSRAIRKAISDQIAAFHRDDAPAAFALAAPSIRRMFGTAQRFLAMVKADYGPVYRQVKYSFVKLTVEDGRTVQQMLFLNAEDGAVFGFYLMERQPDGGWRIAGVVLRSLRTEST